MCELKLRLRKGLQDRACRSSDVCLPLSAILDQHVLQDAQHAGTDRTAALLPVVHLSLNRQERDLFADPQYETAYASCSGHGFEVLCAHAGPRRQLFDAAVRASFDSAGDHVGQVAARFEADELARLDP